jgi:hypothetical protein
MAEEKQDCIVGYSKRSFARSRNQSRKVLARQVAILRLKYKAARNIGYKPRAVGRLGRQRAHNSLSGWFDPSTAHFLLFLVLALAEYEFGDGQVHGRRHL